MKYIAIMRKNNIFYDILQKGRLKLKKKYVKKPNYFSFEK